MFGRAKFATGDAVFNEMLGAIEVVGLQMDRLEFKFNDHDFERMTVWNAASVVYCLKVFGRTDEQSLKTSFTSYIFHLEDNGADSSSLMQRFTEGLQCLGRNLKGNDIEDVKRAAADFRESFEELRQGYGMPKDEFDAWAVASFVAIIQRLAEKKLVKLGS